MKKMMIFLLIPAILLTACTFSGGETPAEESYEAPPETAEQQCAVKLITRSDGAEYISLDNGESWTVDGEPAEKPKVYYTLTSEPPEDFTDIVQLAIHNDIGEDVFLGVGEGYSLEREEDGEWVRSDSIPGYWLGFPLILISIPFGTTYDIQVPLALREPIGGLYRCTAEYDDYTCTAEFTLESCEVTQEDIDKVAKYAIVLDIEDKPEAKEYSRDEIVSADIDDYFYAAVDVYYDSVQSVNWIPFYRGVPYAVVIEKETGRTVAASRIATGMTSENDVWTSSEMKIAVLGVERNAVIAVQTRLSEENCELTFLHYQDNMYGMYPCTFSNFNFVFDKEQLDFDSFEADGNRITDSLGNCFEFDFSSYPASVTKK